MARPTMNAAPTALARESADMHQPTISSISTMPTPTQKVTIEFNDRIVRLFLLAAIIWGVVGMLAGVVIAAQLNYWQLNFDTAYTTFSRLRPLHTNAVIFAFVGNMFFAGVYYSTQRPGEGAPGQ